MRIKVCLYYLFFLLFTIQLFAQTEGEKSTIFTLERCLTVARENHPAIKLAESQISIAGAELTSAFGNYLPNISFNMGYTRQLNAQEGQKINIGGQTIVVGKIEPNSYNMSLSAGYNLFDGFNREAYYNQAKENLNATFTNLSQVQQEVEMNVVRSFFNVLRTQKIVQMRSKNLETAKYELERIRALHEAGSLPITNVLASEADIAQKETELIAAENDLNNAKANLMSAIGLKPTINFDIQEENIENLISIDKVNEIVVSSKTPEKLYSIALSNRLDYTYINQKIAAAQSGLTIARSGYLPNLSAYGGWSWANNEFNKFSELGRSYVGLSLRIPIFENFRTNYQIELARAQILQLDMQKYQLEQKIRSEVIIALNNYEASKKQMESTQKALLAAKKNYESATERYRVGAISSSDYIFANNTLITAELNNINANYSFLVSQIELLYVLGYLNKVQ